jgi:nicotinate-nucleotide pyrophosphorylase (carboxylating)
VIAGLPLVAKVYARLSSAVTLEVEAPDGSAVVAGQGVARLCGPAAALLTGERTALNFLQHLSGIASLTARYVAAVAGTRCRVLDTRKTVPGYRALAKYAVRAGGGWNHRLGLDDRVMLKDNHWAAAAAPIGALVARARREHPELAVEVEVDNLQQLGSVLPLGVEWILLDNFAPAAVAAAVRQRDATPAAARTRLEASGNISLENVRSYAETGADAVSIGRLTHSAPALDLSLEFTPSPLTRGGPPVGAAP